MLLINRFQQSDELAQDEASEQNSAPASTVLPKLHASPVESLSPATDATSKRTWSGQKCWRGRTKGTIFRLRLNMSCCHPNIAES